MLFIAKDFHAALRIDRYSVIKKAKIDNNNVNKNDDIIEKISEFGPKSEILIKESASFECLKDLENKGNDKLTIEENNNNAKNEITIT